QIRRLASAWGDGITGRKPSIVNRNSETLCWQVGGARRPRSCRKTRLARSRLSCTRDLRQGCAVTKLSRRVPGGFCLEVVLSGYKKRKPSDRRTAKRERFH